MLFLPLELPSQSVFIKVSCHKGSHSIVFSLKIPLVKHRNSVLKRGIHEAIIILVNSIGKIKIIHAQDRRCFLTSIEFRSQIHILLAPRSRAKIRSKLRCGQSVFSDDIDSSSHRFCPIYRGCRTFHDFYSLYHRIRDSTQTVDRGKGTHYRHSIDENQRVRPFQPIDMDVSRITNRTVNLRTNPINHRNRF